MCDIYQNMKERNIWFDLIHLKSIPHTMWHIVEFLERGDVSDTDPNSSAIAMTDQAMI